MRKRRKEFYSLIICFQKLFRKHLGFLTTVVIARRAGVNGLGDIGFVLAVYTYFTFLANPGYDTIGARETIRKEIDTSGIINSIFILKFLVLDFCFSYITIGLLFDSVFLLRETTAGSSRAVSACYAVLISSSFSVARIKCTLSH